MPKVHANSHFGPHFHRNSGPLIDKEKLAHLVQKGGELARKNAVIHNSFNNIGIFYDIYFFNPKFYRRLK